MAAQKSKASLPSNSLQKGVRADPEEAPLSSGADPKGKEEVN